MKQIYWIPLLTCVLAHVVRTEHIFTEAYRVPGTLLSSGNTMCTIRYSLEVKDEGFLVRKYPYKVDSQK